MTDKPENYRSADNGEAPAATQPIGMLTAEVVEPLGVAPRERRLFRWFSSLPYVALKCCMYAAIPFYLFYEKLEFRYYKWKTRNWSDSYWATFREPKE